MTGPHPSDERLSAHLDGVEDVAPAGAPELEDHLARCGRCRDRLAALRSASHLVGLPVAPVSPELKAQAVAVALRAGSNEDDLAVVEGESESSSTTPSPDHDPSVPGVRAMPTRWYRRPQVLAGAAAAVVVLGVAVPLALSARSSSTSAVSSHAASSPSASSSTGQSAGTTQVPSGAGLSAGPLEDREKAALPSLGRVSSVEQVVAQLNKVETVEPSSGPSSGQSRSSFSSAEAASKFARCVATTRKAVRGGDYGPGIVATASYRGRAALVMEFWPQASSLAAGKSVVAVTTTNGCKLLARTTT
ncbi:MAG: hypothetical protein ABSH04_08195 [Acidimicrobiales bacterium]